MRVFVEPLTAEAFAPFGDVIERPVDFGRRYYSRALANGRPEAQPSLSLTMTQPVAGLPHTALKMERHEFSSQSFVPIDVARYLVIVAPPDASGRPDAALMRAFLTRGDQGVTYGMNVWHHPLAVLDRPGRFAVFMWLVGGSGDEEFVDLQQPVTIAVRQDT